MIIVGGTTRFFHPVPFRRHNIHLLFGWSLFFHKDAWSCDIKIYNSKRQLDLVWWRRYNTLNGMAWSAIIFGVIIQSAIARESRNKKE